MSTNVSVSDICGDGSGGTGGGTHPDHPILKGYFAAWSTYNEKEPTGFPGSLSEKVPTQEMKVKYQKNTSDMEGKLEKLDEVVYSFFEIKQNSNSNIVATSNGTMSDTSTSYTHKPEDVGKIYFFDAWSDLQAIDSNWIKQNGDLISEGYLDKIGGIENIQYNLGYGNFSAFANHQGDFKKVIGIGGYGDHFQPGWEAATRSGQYNFIESIKRVVDKYNLDGVDLDWEPLSLITDNNMQADFISTVGLLRDELGEDKFIGFPITVDQEQMKHLVLKIG